MSVVTVLACFVVYNLNIKRFQHEQRLSRLLQSETLNYSKSDSSKETVSLAQDWIRSKPSKTPRTSGPNDQRKTITVYHFYHKLLRSRVLKANLSRCHFYKTCHIDNQWKLSAGPIAGDAVLFQGNNVPKVKPLEMSSDQVFVYVNIETPWYLQYTNRINRFFYSFFNWTMTYRVDSDVPFLYGLILPKTISIENVSKSIELTGKMFSRHKHEQDIGDGETFRESGKNYSKVFQGKKKTVLWFNSHCRTSSRREQYVNNIRKYLRVDEYGRCSNNQTNPCPKHVAGCSDVLAKEYKFYLAFENSICDDYLTEKVFDWFRRDIIVVVRGAKNKKSHLPNNTYIDTDDFKSPEHLAKYLIRLGSNNAEYTAFLRRRDNFQVLDGDQYAQFALCHLCFRLYNLDRYRKPGRPLQQWWTEGQCSAPKDI